MTVAYIGIGSNQGNRGALIRTAISHLHEIPESRVAAVSPFYESAAITRGDAQPDFINAVIAVETVLDARKLLYHLHAIEARMGRPLPRAKWQPRAIDLDLLAYGDRILEDSDIRLPHPEIPKRLFVLLPLRDIAPGWHPPVTGESINDLISLCSKHYSSSCVSIGPGGSFAK